MTTVKGEQARPDKEEEKDGPAKPPQGISNTLPLPAGPLATGAGAGPWNIYPSPGRALALVGSGSKGASPRACVSVCLDVVEEGEVG